MAKPKKSHRPPTSEKRVPKTTPTMMTEKVDLTAHATIELDNLAQQTPKVNSTDPKVTKNKQRAKIAATAGLAAGIAGVAGIVVATTDGKTATPDAGDELKKQAQSAIVESLLDAPSVATPPAASQTPTQTLSIPDAVFATIEQYVSGTSFNARLGYSVSKVDLQTLISDPSLSAPADQYRTTTFGASFGFYTWDIPNPELIFPTQTSSGVTYESAQLCIAIDDEWTAQIGVKVISLLPSGQRVEQFIAPPPSINTMDILSRLPVQGHGHVFDHGLPALWGYQSLSNVGRSYKFAAVQYPSVFGDGPVGGFKSNLNGLTGADIWKIALSMMPPQVQPFFENFVVTGGYNSFSVQNSREATFLLSIQNPDARLAPGLGLGQRLVSFKFTFPDPNVFGVARQDFSRYDPAKFGLTILPTFLNDPNYYYLFDGYRHTLTDDASLTALFGANLLTLLGTSGAHASATLVVVNQELRVTLTITRGTGLEFDPILVQSADYTAVLPHSPAGYDLFRQVAALPSDIYASAATPQQLTPVPTTLGQSIYQADHSQTLTPAERGAQIVTQLLGGTSYNFHPDPEVIITSLPTTSDVTAQVMNLRLGFRIGTEDPIVKDFVIHIAAPLGKMAIGGSSITVADSNAYMPIGVPTAAELVHPDGTPGILAFDANINQFYTFVGLKSWTVVPPQGQSNGAATDVTAVFTFIDKATGQQVEFSTTLVFGKTLHQRVEAAFDNAFPASKTGVVIKTTTGNLDATELNPTTNDFGAWWAELSDNHPAVFDSPDDTTDGVHYHVTNVAAFSSADDTKYGLTDATTGRGYWVSVEAYAVDASGNEVPGTKVTRVLPVVATVSYDTQDKLQAWLASYDIVPTTALLQRDFRDEYFAPGVHSMSASSFGAYFDSRNLPPHVRMTKVSYTAPGSQTGIDSHEWTFEIEFTYDDGTKRVTATREYQIMATYSFRELCLREWLGNLNLPAEVTSTGYARLNHDQWGTAAADATPAAATQAQLGGVTALLSEILHLTGDWGYYQHSHHSASGGSVELVSYTYTYDASSPDNTAATFVLTFADSGGGASQDVTMKVNFAQSYAAHISDDVLANFKLKVSAAYTNIVTSGSAITPVTHFTTSPTSAQIELADGQAQEAGITWDVEPGSFKYANADSTVGSVVVNLHYGTFTFKKTLSFNFSTSKNQYIVDLLPTTITLGSGTPDGVVTAEPDFSHHTTDLVAYVKSLLPVGADYEFMRNAAFTIEGDITNPVVASPSQIANGERLHDEYEIHVKVGAATKVIKLVANIDPDSALAMQIWLTRSDQFGALDFSPTAELLTHFGTAINIMKSAASNTFSGTADFSQYLAVGVERGGAAFNQANWLTQLANQGITFTSAAITPPADPDNTEATLSVVFTNASGVQFTYTTKFNYAASQNDLLFGPLVATTTDYATPVAGFATTSAGVVGIDDQLAFNPATYAVLGSETASNIRLGAVFLVQDKTTGTFKIMQPVSFTVHRKDFTINFTLANSSKLYLQYVIENLIEFDMSDADKMSSTYKVETLVGDATTHLVVTRKADKTVVPLTNYFPSSMIVKVEITKIPTNAATMGEATITLKGGLTQSFKFNYAKSPNAIILEKLTDDSSHLLTSSALTQTNGQVVATPKSPTATVIATVAPETITTSDFLDYMRTNTNLDFPLSLSGTGLTFDPISVSDVSYKRDNANADQTVTVTFASGTMTRKIVFSLHFAKSQIVKEREDGLEALGRGFFTPRYLATGDFRKPVLGIAANPQGSDFLLNDLVKAKYVVTGVGDFTPPTGDSRAAVVTLTIVDNADGVDHAPQTVTVNFDFDQSPNEAKTHALAALDATTATVDDAAGVPHRLYTYTFGTFTPAGSTPQGLVWPVPNDPPTITHYEKVTAGVPAFQEEFKLEVAYGKAAPVTVYVRGELDHRSAEYLRLATEDVRIMVPSSVANSPTEHRLQVLTATEMSDARIVVSDPATQDPDDIRLINPFLGRLIVRGDVLITKVEIIQIPTGDSTTGRVRLTFAPCNENGEQVGTVTITKEVDFSYKYSANYIRLHQFSANIPNDATVGALNGAPLQGSATTNLVADATLSGSALLQAQTAWINSATNLVAQATGWGIPTGTTISGISFTLDPTSKNQEVTVTYSLGEQPDSAQAATVSHTFTFTFTETPNQASLASLPIDSVLSILNSYTNRVVPAGSVAPTTNSVAMKAGFELSGTNPIHDFIAPTNDATGGSVQIDVQRTNDPTATHTFTVALTFSRSVDEARKLAVEALGEFYVDPYVDGVPTAEDIANIDALLGLASSITNIVAVPAEPGDGNNGITARYVATVHFGALTAAIRVLHTSNPLEQSLNRVLQGYHFDVDPAVKAAHPHDYGTPNANPDFRLYDSQGAPAALPAGVRLVDPVVYTGPQGDNTEATLTFGITFSTMVYVWTNPTDPTHSERGTTEFGQSHPTWTRDAGASESVTVTRKLTFDYAHSPNYYALENFVSSMVIDFGASGYSAQNPTPIQAAPPAQLQGGTPAAMVAYLESISNFNHHDYDAANVSVSAVAYTYDATVADAKVSLTLKLGTAEKTVEVVFHFAKSNDQSTLDTLTETELLLGLSTTYLDHAISAAPTFADFTVRAGYAVSSVGTFTPPANADSKTASVEVTVWASKNHQATRIITYPVTFAHSANEAKLAQLSDVYEVDAFWQADVTPLPTDDTLLANLIMKLAPASAAAFDPNNLPSLTAFTPVDVPTIQKYGATFARGWRAELTLGTATKTVYFGQTDNPLETKFNAILQGLRIGVGDKIGGDVLTHPVPTSADLTFTKNGQPFVLPADSNSADGSFTVRVDTVDQPATADDKTATIHYTATFTLRSGGVDHTYVQRKTATFDYRYSMNEIAVQTVIRAVGTTDAATHAHTLAGKTGVTLASEAPATLADATAFAQYLQTYSTTDLPALLAANGVQVTGVNYASNNLRDDAAANQNVSLTLTKGSATFTIQVVMPFAKSHNQAMLDALDSSILFGTPIQSYIHVTKPFAPTAADLVLIDAHYEVTGISNFQAPSADPNDPTGLEATVSVVVRSVTDHNAVRTFNYKLHFETFGIDVTTINAATVSYTSQGQTVASLPGGGSYTFTATDPAVNGYATLGPVAVQRRQPDGTMVSAALPDHTRLEYRVVTTRGATESVVRDWAATVPTNLENGQVVVVRVVSEDPTQFTVTGTQAIYLAPVQNLAVLLAFPADYVVPTPTYLGAEGAGTLIAPTLPAFYANYGLASQTPESAHLTSVFTVTHKDAQDDPAPIHVKVSADTIKDLRVGMYVYVNLEPESGYFLVNPFPAPGQPLGQVAGLKVQPSVGLDQIGVSTARPDGSRGHDGNAAPTLVPAGDNAPQSAYPTANDYWEWRYQVVRNGAVVTDWSATPPVDLQNGDELHVNYLARPGYTIDHTFTDRIFIISDLQYEVTLPADFTPATIAYAGYEGRGHLVPPVGGWFTASDFPYQDDVTLEFRVLDFQGRVKHTYTSATRITDLSVGDVVYAQVVTTSDDYVLMNPQVDILIGTVDNLQIIPRILASSLRIAITGVSGQATLALQDQEGSTLKAQPFANIEHWHWEYQVTDAVSGTTQVVHPWSATVPTDLANGQTVIVRVAADEHYQLDSVYDEATFVVENLKFEVDLSATPLPVLTFAGYLGAGVVESVTTGGTTPYVLPDHVHWEYYVAPISEIEVDAEARMSDVANWHQWNAAAGGQAGPTDLTVGMRIYMRIMVDDPDHYVLSRDFRTPPITVTHLAIDTSQVHANYKTELFEGEGHFTITFDTPDTAAQPNVQEGSLVWVASVNNGPEQSIGSFNNLKNGDAVRIRALPVNPDYYIKPGEEITTAFTVAGLPQKVDTSGLNISNWKRFADVDTPTVVVSPEDLAKIISGSARLLLAEVRDSQGIVVPDGQLPPHVHLRYKFIPVDAPVRTFDAVPATDTPPPPAAFHRRGLANGDRIMIFLWSDDPAYRVSDTQEVQFLVSRLSPEPPVNLHPVFIYNNGHENQGYNGQGYGATMPFNENIDGFKWVYYVARYPDNGAPYVANNLPVLPENPAWTDTPPTKLRNGDVVFYKLATEIAGGVIQEGSFEDSVTHEQVRTDYQSGPLLISGLIEVINVDTTALQNLQLSFEGSNSEGYIKEASSQTDVFATVRQQIPAVAQLNFYLNGVKFDPTSTLLKNGDRIEIRIVPPHGVSFDTPNQDSLRKVFVVDGLKEVVAKKQQTVKIVLYSLAAASGIGIILILIWWLMRKRKRRPV